MELDGRWKLFLLFARCSSGAPALVSPSIRLYVLLHIAHKDLLKISSDLEPDSRESLFCCFSIHSHSSVSPFATRLVDQMQRNRNEISPNRLFFSRPLLACLRVHHPKKDSSIKSEPERRKGVARICHSLQFSKVKLYSTPSGRRAILRGTTTTMSKRAKCAILMASSEI
jgi:hypothetical protein